MKRITTFAACKAALKTDGITLTKKDGDYRVNFVGGKEETAYYTDSLNDAFNTGLLMAHPVESLQTIHQSIGDYDGTYHEI